MWESIGMGALLFGVAVIIYILAKKSPQNILAGTEHALEATEHFLEDTPFFRKYGFLVDAALDLVQGAEQLKRAGKISAKDAKKVVKASLKEIAEKADIDVSDRILDLIVESAVLSVNFFVKDKEKSLKSNTDLNNSILSQIAHKLPQSLPTTDNEKESES